MSNSTTIMPTVSRCRQISDGTVVCASCKKSIRAGLAFIHDMSGKDGFYIVRSICMECQEQRETSPLLPVAAAFMAVAAIAFAAVMGM